ncbi:hypothetical protein DSL72_003069 [Monilinia vaccinii-corymbosi]|uniref:NACHT-NTPase and P-loop NTPases N-terminal domain-containing protein n=1 Tax=Monilinia vaccinii-corymbosi TaxID=61207 RepID=A0A8A3P197_9HELO|nr:hypothetical protein DSL72_003069 [Monilinia vaccinii-corymbosi]
MARSSLLIIIELVHNAAGYCRCLPKVFGLVDKDTVVALGKLVDPEAASGEILAKYGDAQQGFRKFQSGFDQIANDIGHIQDGFGTVKQSIEDVVESFRNNITPCVGTAMLESNQAIVDLKSEIASVVDDIKTLVTIFTDAIDDFDTLDDFGIAKIVDKIINEEISSIKQLVGLLPAAKKLPNIIIDHVGHTSLYPKSRKSVDHL